MISCYRGPILLGSGSRTHHQCGRRTGHHKDRPDHLSMMSYRDLTGRMRRAGFGRFLSPLFRKPPMVSTRFKIFLEEALTAVRMRTLWSHLGVRNVLVVATKEGG